MIKLNFGQERFIANAGEIPDGTKVLCGVCGDKYNEQFRVFIKDEFYCLNYGRDWHIQARKLIQDAKECNSKYLSEIMLEEVREILENKKVTKKSGILNDM